MTDLELARGELRSGNQRLVVAAKGEVIWRSDDPMVWGLLACLDAMGDVTQGSSMADTVVGKAAALLAHAAGMVAVYAPLVSEPAVDYLQRVGIPLEYGKLVPTIMSRSQDDVCPLERLTAYIDDPEEAVSRIRGFYQKMVTKDMRPAKS